MKISPLLVSCFLLTAFASVGHADTPVNIPVGNFSFTSPDLQGTYDANNSSTSNDDPNQTMEEYSLVPGLGSQVAGANADGVSGDSNAYIPDWTAASNGGVVGVDNPVGSMYPGTGGDAANGGSDPGSDGLLPGTADGYTFALLNLGAGGTGSLTYSGPSLGNFSVGDTYTLTVAIGVRADAGGGGASASYKLELLNNGSVVDSTPLTLASTSGTFDDLTL